MPYLRFLRDERGYEHTYVLHGMESGSRPSVLYWFRTPPNVSVGREPLDEGSDRGARGPEPRSHVRLGADDEDDTRAAGAAAVGSRQGGAPASSGVVAETGEAAGIAHLPGGNGFTGRLAAGGIPSVAAT